MVWGRENKVGVDVGKRTVRVSQFFPGLSNSRMKGKKIRGGGRKNRLSDNSGGKINGTGLHKSMRLSA